MMQVNDRIELLLSERFGHIFHRSVGGPEAVDVRIIFYYLSEVFLCKKMHLRTCHLLLEATDHG